MSTATVKPAKRDWSADVQTTAIVAKPTRLTIHGVEGAGKSSLAMQSPHPFALMVEDGIAVLIASGQQKPIPRLPVHSWLDAMSQLNWLATAEHTHRTVIIDTLNGLERLCHEYVCEKQYGGRWGKDGFTSYMQGFEVSLADWRELLNALDKLRDRGIGIICLAHTKIAPFRNPEGADYERYQPAIHSKTWELTSRWADMVGFMNFETFVDDKGARPKGVGGQRRLLYTERHAAYDAKNRFGLAPEIDLGESAAEGWKNFVTALQAAKQKGGAT